MQSAEIKKRKTIGSLTKRNVETGLSAAVCGEDMEGEYFENLFAEEYGDRVWYD